VIPLSRPAATVAVIAVLLAIGWWAPRVLIGDGVAQFASGAERVVAAEALALADEVCMSDPLSRIVVPAVRVVEVEEAPGSCTMYPNTDDPYVDHRATIRGYTLFGLPARRFEASCGGRYVRCR
jgi:hypothetical protein